ncbi:MAG: hypothetical protein IT170_08280 [Bryobacterales bacterium]|nr:hypothetical protein [Bryobacterales bacterium]
MHPHPHSDPPSPERRKACSAGAPREPVPDPRAELLSVLVTIAVIGSEPLDHLRSFAFYAPLVLAYVLSRERALWPALRRVAPLLPVLAMLALGLPLSRALDAWLGAASQAGIDPGAWAAALSLFLRAFAAVLLVSVLVKFNGLDRILQGLRRLGLPPAVVLTLQHLERYRLLIADEWRRTSQARESRSPGGTQFAFASYVNQTSLIFLRSWERGERIHSAMLARGFRLDAPAPVPVGNAGSHAQSIPFWRALLSGIWLPALALLVRLAV